MKADLKHAIFGGKRYSSVASIFAAGIISTMIFLTDPIVDYNWVLLPYQAEDFLLLAILVSFPVVCRTFKASFATTWVSEYLIIFTLNFLHYTTMGDQFFAPPVYPLSLFYSLWSFLLSFIFSFFGYVITIYILENVGRIAKRSRVQ